MTAVVAILNTQGIAIAADSAVTSNGRISNNALKIFTLSKYQPVGVAIYGNSSFLATPWETIIKIYRSKLKDKSFPSLSDYQKDFIQFLHDKSFFCDPSFSDDWVKYSIRNFLDNLVFGAAKKNWDNGNNADKLQKLNTEINTISSQVTVLSICTEFTDYTYETFTSDYGALVSAIILEMTSSHSIVIDDPTTELISTLAYSFIKCQEFFSPFTGIVFVGYGEDQVFPAITPIRVYFPVKTRLRYWCEGMNTIEISNTNSTGIVPFAQTDAMNTLLKGIAPKLETELQNQFLSFFQDYNKIILALIGDGMPDLTTAVNNIDTKGFLTKFQEAIVKTQNTHYINPLHSSISSLTKEALAEMAESLIYLTFMQKRITLEPENMGGNVDVAIISKGDGFIWIKRKHYFKRELNEHFFANYFNDSTKHD